MAFQNGTVKIVASIDCLADKKLTASQQAQQHSPGSLSLPLIFTTFNLMLGVNLQFIFRLVG
ncbi:hypothetical protein BIY29_10920 [Brenneria alni]|uniref:Uncharacterized protein n=1 Tax=Brenneria alni TaxID=71656 RepID=A0A421DN91_9GAMM|nr:hypothetical protein BIY29_10920 [Brenneria alni]